MKTRTQNLRHRFLATGVGSLSQQDPKEAVDLVLDVLGQHVPFWPQLPRADFRENMYVQFCEQLPGAVVDLAGKTIRMDLQQDRYPEDLEACFQNIQEGNLDYFSISRDVAAGLYGLTDRLSEASWQGMVKGQLIGPLSLALSLLDEKKQPILYNAELREILPSYLAMKAAWLVRQLKVHSRTEVIVFVDEPYLVAVGTNQCSLPKRDIIAMINRVVEAIHADGAMAGLHCCGNTDWGLVMETDIDILNFDAYGYGDKFFLYGKSVTEFLKKGGIPALGIVPNTGELLGKDVVEDAWKRLAPYRKFLENGALITTSCGCSGLAEDLTRRALASCVDVARRLEKEIPFSES